MKTLIYSKAILRASLICAFFAAFVFSLSSCNKYVTPKKVVRKITKDSWAIGTFNYMDSTFVSQFANLTFGFGEDGRLRVVEDNNANGRWIVSESKKPTIMYISSFIDTPYVFLNDDWTVTRISKDAISMESDNGAYVNQLNMTRIED